MSALMNTFFLNLACSDRSINQLFSSDIIANEKQHSSKRFLSFFFFLAIVCLFIVMFYIFHVDVYCVFEIENKIQNITLMVLNF